MNDQRARIADIGDLVEELERIDEGLSGGESIPQLEPDEPAIAAPQVGMRASRGVVGPQARIIDVGNRRVARQEVGHRRGVLHMLPDPERQCLQPLNDLERIRRAERPAEITKQCHPRL